MRTTRKIYLAVVMVLALVSSAFAAPINPNTMVSAYTPDADTQVLWHLNDAATGLLDSSGNGRNFDQAIGNVTYNPSGRFDGASDFAFGDVRILQKDPAGFNALGASQSSLTVEMWFKTDRAQQQAFLLEAFGTEGYAIRVDNDPGVGRYIEAALQVDNIGYVGLFSTSPIDDNQWHHIALTRDKTTGLTQLYFDGVVEDAVTIGAGENLYGQDSNVGVRVGWPWMSPGLGFYGLIDEIRISSTDREFVPEPTTMALLAIGGLLLRKRRHA